MTTASLPRSAPESHGIEPAAIGRFIQAIEQDGLELHSLMLVKDGDVVAEGWWHPYRPELKHSLFSLSKSYTSSAVGMAVAEGLLSLDDRVASFFPEDLPAEPSARLLAMQVRHLLMMGTGHTEDTMEALHRAEDGHWVRAFLACPVNKEPGTHFLYNTGATYMLSAIIREVAGVDLLDYLQPRLLAPLGIEGAVWERCPRGLSAGGFGLNITTEDIAKFGLLYLNKGSWEGRQLLSPDWIAEATAKQINSGDGGESDWAQGYGYQFWRCRHGVYRGDGAFGQFCVVMPELNAVLAMTAGTGNLQGVLNQAWTHLLPALQEHRKGNDGDAAAALAKRLAGLRLALPEGEAASDLEQAISGSSYRLSANERKWTSLMIAFTETEAVLTLRGDEREDRLSYGRGAWAEGESDLLGYTRSEVAASFVWERSDRLRLTMRFIETPFCLTSTIDFDGDSVTLEHRMNVGFGDQEAVRIQGRR